MAIVAVRDLDDTGAIGLRRSDITIDGKTSITKHVTTHISTSNQITVRKVSWLRKTGEFVHRADGWFSDSDNEIDFRFPFAGASSRGGGGGRIEQCPISQPRDQMHSYSPSTQALLRMLLLCAIRL